MPTKGTTAGVPYVPTPEGIKAYNKAYRIANKERLAALAASPETKAKLKAWRQERKAAGAPPRGQDPKRRAYMKAYYEEHRDPAAPRMGVGLAARFQRHVGPPAESGCVLWTGSSSRGYGMIKGDGSAGRGAHRVAWELARGPIPEGMDVLHNCPGGDNPGCVNVEHLWLGTHAENMADMVAKGRSRPWGRLPKKTPG